MSHMSLESLTVGVAFKSGAFETKPVLKVLGTPWSINPAHVCGVKSWPLTYLKSFAIPYSNEVVYDAVRGTFVATLKVSSSPSFAAPP